VVLNLVSNSLVLSVASNDSEQVGLYQTGLALRKDNIEITDLYDIYFYID